MSFDAEVKSYLKELQKKYNAAIQGGQYTPELSYRITLSTFFHNITGELNSNPNIDIAYEPKKQGQAGRPDWKIYDKKTLGVYGFVDGKGLSVTPFDLTPYQEQIKRYLSLKHTLVFTDGIEFAFFFSDSPKMVSVFDKEQAEASDWSTLPINPLFYEYMKKLFRDPKPVYLNEGELVGSVAIRTRNLSDEIFEHADLTEEEALDEDERKVIVLLNGMKNLIYNHNDPALRNGQVFSDFVAQIIMFCLLYAYLTLCSDTDSPTEKENKIKKYAFEDLDEEEALSPFRNLMVYLHDNHGSASFINQWIEECIEFLSFVQLTDDQLTDPDYHHLFELFLEKFDKKIKFDYGAYYTPKPLADFVVRLTNRVVSEDLDGTTVYDDGNTIIDPCCGTGSFLERLIVNDNGDGAYNLCGFEILPAPYMLANYRMSVVEKNYHKQNLDINILLANTLSNYLLGENADPESIEGRELIRANELSSLPLKLIIGNPPSADSGGEKKSHIFSEITKLTNDFRPPKEEIKGRQNIQKQINNTFMQFLRWSCEKLLNSETHSALSFVLPLSFLEGESYKGARKYLVEHFSHVWVVAVDPDARATGIRGNSLFNTLQGRAVVILTRRYGDSSPISEINYLDISKAKRDEKIALLETDVDTIMDSFETFNVTTEKSMYSFSPGKSFDTEMYSSFWPVSNVNGKAVFLYQCSGAKQAPTCLMTHVKSPMLNRRSREIAKARSEKDSINKAREWVGRQDKPAADSKVKAFRNALRPYAEDETLNSFLKKNIRPCSFRPFLNSYALISDAVFKSLIKADGKGTRPRPEIETLYGMDSTIGFSLAHAPKDLSESLQQFTSFCWYYPDNDIVFRGDGHVYLNQYVTGEKHDNVVNNINVEILNHFSDLCGLNNSELARKMVFYSYAVFCSQVYLDEFYGALYVVSQFENRARIPIVSDETVFLKLAELGEKLADLEKNDVQIENVLELDYDGLLEKLPDGFHLYCNKLGTKIFDEENECLTIRDEPDETEISIDCPIAIQRFKVAGYHVVRYWIKFHSYRFTHCDFTKEDFKELLDLLNKIMTHMQYVSSIDEIIYDIVSKKIPLLPY